MEALKGYQGLSHTNVDAFDYNIFNILFRKCTTEWEYQGNKTIANSGSIFANLQYYYMALVYLQPGLKKFKSMRPNDFNSMDSDDNAAFLSMMFERFGGRPIIPENYEARNMVNRLGEIGEYEILPALVDDKLGFTVGERIYRYMIEIKWKNNPEALARWISEYNEVYGEYEILSAEDYVIFKKACDEVYRKHASSRSADTALDFGYVIDPSKFESRISFDDSVAAMADHYQHNFQDSQFYKNRNNAEYVAKTYAMVKAMCENEAFTDITDIYACIVNLVEHSYGYDSTEILLTDTQVVHLMASLEEGDYDTDQDNLLDRQELDHEENVNISNLLEEYIKYNRLPEEEANKLRADPYIKMWAYKSNPALPDTDFDGRNDDYDFHRPLENRQSGKMSTLNYERVNFDYCQDYRYFFMPSTQYYYELSEMSMVLANMVNKKSGINRRWNKDTNYVNRIADDGGGITTNSYRETYNTNGIAGYMNYIGLDDIEEYDMSNTVGDSNVCRYAIGHRDVVYALGRTQNVVRNVIAISIGDIEAKAAQLYANFDGHAGREGDYTEYHHVGFDIVANRILEKLERYASRYAPRYQKVYWITGEGGGGSVANLLAQKMIKKNGNKNVYCYTFQALNTINCNNIPAVQRISNEPYGSIFNLYNDDNQTLQIYTNKNLFFKYGVNKHVSVTSSSTYKSIWRNCYNDEHGGYINYPTGNNTTLPNYINDFVKLSQQLSQTLYAAELINGAVYAFTGTEQINETEVKIVIDEKTFFELIFNDPESNRKYIDDFEAFYQGLQDKGVDAEYMEKWNLAAYNSANNTNITNMKQHVRALIDDTRSKLKPPFISSMKDIGSLPKVLDDVATDPQKPSVGSTGATEEIDEFAKFDMIPFDDSYKIKEFCVKDINFDYQKGKTDIAQENKCINIGESNIVFSNYTIEGTKNVDCWDISFSQFWNEDKRAIQEELGYNVDPLYYAPHYFLYQYDAGDFSKINTNTRDKATRMIFGQYRLNHPESDRLKIIDGVDGVSGYGEFFKEIYNDNGYTATMKTLDGRIIAAFPMHLLIASDENIVSELYNNQMHKYRNYLNKDNAFTQRFQSNKYTQKIRKLAEDYRMYSYVDVVMQSSEGYQYVIPFMSVDMKALTHILDTAENAGKLIHHAMMTDNSYGHMSDSLVNGILQYSHMNPIEPYIQIKKDGHYHDEKIEEEINGNEKTHINTDINKAVARAVFDTTGVNDKIISIRIYNKKFDVNNPNWWKQQRDAMKKVTKDDYRIKSIIENEYKNNGIVVDY